MEKTAAEIEKRNRILLGSVLFSSVINGAAAQPLGSFIPFLRESYDLSYEFTGIMLSLQSAGNMLAVILAGILPFVLGRRRSILILGGWMCVSYILLASGTGAPAVLLLACLMNGVSRGGSLNFGTTMMSTLPEKMAVKGYNLLHGSFALGALCSPLLLVLFDKLRPETGWRIMAGFLAALLVLQYINYIKMPVPEIKAEKNGKKSDRSFLREKNFWLTAVMLFCYVSAEYAIVGWMVTYFQDIGVLRPEHAQLTNSLLWVVIFIGRMLGAALSGRVPGIKILMFDGVGQFVFFLIMFMSRNPLVIILSLMGVGFSLSTIYPAALGFGSDCIKNNDLGVSILIFSGSVGGIITPYLVGLIAGRAGIRAGMGLVVLLTGLLLFSILLSFISSGRKRRP